MHEYLVVSLVLMLGYFGPSIFVTRYMHWYVVLGYLLLVLGSSFLSIVQLVTFLCFYSSFFLFM
jgi:hypothetical protein